MRRLVYQSIKCAWSWVIAHEPKMWHQAMLKDVSPVFSQVVNLKRNNGSSPSSNGWNDIGSGSIANLNIQASLRRGKLSRDDPHCSGTIRPLHTADLSSQ